MLSGDGCLKTDPLGSHDQPSECACRGGKREGKTRHAPKARHGLSLLHSSSHSSPAAWSPWHPLPASEALCCSVEAMRRMQVWDASSSSTQRGSVSLIALPSAGRSVQTAGLWGCGSFNCFSFFLSHRLRGGLFGFPTIFV